MKKKLKVYTLEWSSSLGWYGSQSGPRWVLKNARRQIIQVYRGNKAEAIKTASGLLNAYVITYGEHSELRIRNKNGTFAPARTYPRSADPKRSKG